MTLSAEGATSTVGSGTCPSGSEAATTSGCVTADPLYDPTDFTPGGGDTGTVLISPLIKPGTVSSTYYNHYSTLRTLEDLFLTGQSCTEPTNPTPRWPPARSAAGLDGQGHIGYAAQPGLAAFGPDVFTAQQFSVVAVPPGLHHGRRQRRRRLVLPEGHQPRCRGRRRPSGYRRLRQGSAAWPERPGCGTSGGKGGNGGNGTTAAGPGVTEATAATAPARPRNGSAESG